jgi:hypothetical protein
VTDQPWMKIGPMFIGNPRVDSLEYQEVPAPPPVPPVVNRKFKLVPKEELEIIVKYRGLYSQLKAYVDMGKYFFMVELLEDRYSGETYYGNIMGVEREHFWVRVAAGIPLNLRDSMVFRREVAHW